MGLARVADGADLVRIGAPLRPEFAAWRYRNNAWRRQRLVQFGAAGALAVGAAAAVVIGVAVVPFVVAGTAVGFAGRMAHWAMHGVPGATVARLTTPHGALRVRRRHLLATRLLAPGDAVLRLSVAHEGEASELAGEDALRAASVLLPASNWLSGDADDVRRAVTRLAHVGDPERFVRDFARRGPRLTAPARDQRAERLAGREAADGQEYSETGLMALDPSLRLAVEMALHEDRERRAMEGELAELERAWRDAESIAAIADDFLLPDRVHRTVARLRGRGGVT